MILLYIFAGLLLSAVGAVPLGASNIAVITTTSNESLSKGLHIARGAGVGEVVLAFFALWYTKILTTFFEVNPWVQLSFIGIFFVVGMLFLLSNKINFSFKKPTYSRKKPSKFLTGFLLALINPPVLIFWMIAISLTQKYVVPISSMSPILILLLFFMGVYLGKFITLYFYGKLSHKSSQKQQRSEKYKLYRIIGVALILVSTIQVFRFFIN